MSRNTDLDVDRRVLRTIRSAKEITAAEVARKWVTRYSGAYIYSRLHLLEASGLITLDRSHGRRGIMCRPVESAKAEEIAAEA